MKTELICLGFGLLIASAIAAAAVVPIFKQHNELCEVYCNCSITHNCIYTFDYSEVKNCECEK